MKIKCINNRGFSSYLTHGKIYEAKLLFGRYLIEDDEGNTLTYRKELFEVISEVPRYVDTEKLSNIEEQYKEYYEEAEEAEEAKDKPNEPITLGEFERMQKEAPIESAEFKPVDDRVQLFKDIVDEMFETYKRKNNDYGNSVGDTYLRYGDVSFLVRIEDKINRLKSLTVDKKDIQVADEKIEDTIMDLANYAILYLIERKIDK